MKKKYKKKHEKKVYIKGIKKVINEPKEPENKEIKGVFEDISNYMDDDIQTPDDEEVKDIKKPKENVIRVKESKKKLLEKLVLNFKIIKTLI